MLCFLFVFVFFSALEVMVYSSLHMFGYDKLILILSLGQVVT